MVRRMGGVTILWLPGYSGHAAIDDFSYYVPVVLIVGKVTRWMSVWRRTDYLLPKSLRLCMVAINVLVGLIAVVDPVHNWTNGQVIRT